MSCALQAVDQSGLSSVETDEGIFVLVQTPFNHLLSGVPWRLPSIGGRREDSAWRRAESRAFRGGAHVCNSFGHQVEDLYGPGEERKAKGVIECEPKPKLGRRRCRPCHGTSPEVARRWYQTRQEKRFRRGSQPSEAKPLRHDREEVKEQRSRQDQQ